MTGTSQSWVQSNKKTITFAICSAFFLRILLFSIPNLSFFFQQRFEFSTPLTSYMRLNNCLFTFSHQILQSTPSSTTPRLEMFQYLSPYTSDTCTIPLMYIFLGRWIQTFITQNEYYQQLVWYIIIAVSDIIMALSITTLLSYYSQYTIPIPLSLSSFNTIATLTSGTSNELALLLKQPNETMITDDDYTHDNSTPFAKLIFLMLLFNPISLFSNLALNLAHITLALHATAILLTAMLPINLFTLFLTSILSGLILLLDIQYIYCIPSFIALLSYRYSTDNALTESIKTKTNAFSLGSKSRSRTKQITRSSIIFSSYPLLVILYVVPIIVIYCTMLYIEHLLNNTHIELIHHLYTIFTQNPLTRMIISPSDVFFSLSATLFGTSTTLETPSTTSNISLLLHSISVQYQYNKTRPSIGAMWYFFVQIFARFRVFYTLIFPAPLMVTAIGLPLRLPKYPLLTLAAITALATIFHPTPTFHHILYSAALVLANFSTYQSKINRISLLLLISMHVCVGMIVMWYIWTGLGSGNANFLFFQGIFFAVSLLMLIVEVVAAVRRLQSIPPGMLEAETLKSDKSR